MNLQELSDAFRKFAGHRPNCDYTKQTAKECSCGFVQVFNALEPNGNVPCGTPMEMPPYQALKA